LDTVAAGAKSGSVELQSNALSDTFVLNFTYTVV